MSVHGIKAIESEVKLEELYTNVYYYLLTDEQKAKWPNHTKYAIIDFLIQEAKQKAEDIKLYNRLEVIRKERKSK